MAQFKKNIQRIGVFTSGGDAPGMNAAIRAVVRTAIANRIEVYGIHGGYQGIVDERIYPLGHTAVANIIQRGGTILKTGRCLEFHKAEVRAKAHENLIKQGIDAMVCIGGDGSFAGAHQLWLEHQFPIIGVPGTIDNDINGTENTIGFDTAVNTAMEAIDRIRDTATSHDRLFIVEVMGRNSGYIAAEVGVAGGAEEIFTPDGGFNVDKTVDKIRDGIKRGKLSSILIAAEGQKPGRAYDLAESIRKKSGFDAKVCILGHIQRGGTPSAADRVLASQMGVAAVEGLIQGQCDVMIGTEKTQFVFVPLERATKRNTTPKNLLQLAATLSI